MEAKIKRAGKWNAWRFSFGLTKCYHRDAGLPSQPE